MGTIVRIVFLAILMAGCSRVQYVPVETVRTDSVYIVNSKIDSVHVSDSIYIYLDTRQDTIIRTEYRQKTIYRDRIKIDTVKSVCVDSVQVPFPVEKNLTKWQQVKQEFGGYCMIVIIITLIVIFCKMVYKLVR